MFKTMFFTHYKTTLAGVAGILGVIAKIATTKHVEISDVTAFTAGVGLIVAADPQKAPAAAQ